MKEPLIILGGPTGTGKTELSLRIAKEIPCEIISADSVQVYRGMDIGSAKIRPEDKEGIPHHLIDCLDPDEPFDVSRFVEMASEKIREIRSRDRIPMVVGGTAFYTQALIKDIDFEEEEHDGYREELYKIANEKGKKYLHKMLRDVDIISAGIIHENNIKRVVRALEFYHENGYPISSHNEFMKEKESPYNYIYFVLTDERSHIYSLTDKRVDAMIDMGLVEEVKGLINKGYTKDLQSMQALGYKQIAAYLNGEYDFEEAVRLIKRDTRHFVKRQLTWYRYERSIIEINKSEFEYDNDVILSFMMDNIREAGII